ncbi:(2Fe-2S)-binding protein [Streptomyces sp. SAJ15]|uniref:(2Fe-2S)-binding protein n=1 Tax=Streptomyces sp. SAJ15 TaxID=2011095 RepID=UPI00118706EE|nr:(2Fe-2S)-binding protein [Streptomyces sp. SAJ15]TVL92883.1 oxidoreductase [Streptomyces sp. SAJ15]
MRVNLTVNGRPQTADDVWEGESLLYVLRERLGLPGSKNACEQGECGSCTVRLDGVPVCSCLVAAGQAEGRDVVTVEGLADFARRRAEGGCAGGARDPGDGSGAAADAADPADAASASETPSGAASGGAAAAGADPSGVGLDQARAWRPKPADPAELAPIQKAFIDAGAVQCGFCTPGLLVAADELLERNTEPSDADIREALSGNLCRCTGYEKILDAVRLAAARAERAV